MIQTGRTEAGTLSFFTPFIGDMPRTLPLHPMILSVNALFTTVEELSSLPSDTFFRIHGTSSRNLLLQYANICVNETKIHFTGLLANADSGVEDVVVSSK